MLAVARDKGTLRGKKPKLPPSAQRSVAAYYATGQISLADLAEVYSVSRTTIHRLVTRHRSTANKPAE